MVATVDDGRIVKLRPDPEHPRGHRGGWQLANSHGGTNVNLLAGAQPEDLERLAGMAHLNGIPVRVTPVAAAPASAAGADAEPAGV
jgi:hypothetical protein